MMAFIATCFAWFIYALPWWLRHALGDSLGFVLRVFSVRAGVVHRNLELAFPGARNEKKREDLFRSAYSHLGNLVLEIFFVLGPMQRFVLKYSELRGAEHWKKAHEKGKGVIFLASHVGNWEVMVATGTLNTPMDLVMVTKQVKPAWLHRAIEAGRKRYRVLAAYEPRTLKTVIAHLNKGGTVGFILDQYAGPPIGVRVPVFGVPVGTSPTIAALARRTGATVLPAVNYRTGKGRFVLEMLPGMEWSSFDNPHYEIAANTARYAAKLEQHIYEHPEQWLWIHRRFKGDLGPLQKEEWTEGRKRH